MVVIKANNSIRAHSSQFHPTIGCVRVTEQPRNLMLAMVINYDYDDGGNVASKHVRACSYFEYNIACSVYAVMGYSQTEKPCTDLKTNKQKQNPVYVYFCWFRDLLGTTVQQPRPPLPLPPPLLLTPASLLECQAFGTTQ